MPQPLLLAIDQGTSSTRAMLFNTNAEVIACAQQEFESIYPQHSWVEQDPKTILNSVMACCRSVLSQLDPRHHTIVGLGITNQRETTILWDKRSGDPIYNAIVWQDRRTEELCSKLKHDNFEPRVKEKTGLLLDPYFSASKINWILDNVSGARKKAAAGHIAFGTVDSYLIWQLTGGQTHATDVTNASRTNLFNIHRCEWDADLLRLFDIPESILPQVYASTDHFGVADLLDHHAAIPISGVAGDQQAALVGQLCFDAGDLKSTYGTGCFALLNTGSKVAVSKAGLLSTIAYQIGNTVNYALEGSIFSAGSSIKWLRDQLQIIKSAQESESIASALTSNGGVYFVPAFSGLGAPYWHAQAKAAIVGLSLNSGHQEIVRAALEASAYQSVDLLAAMQNDGITPLSLKIDGGMASNDWYCQFLANMAQIDVERSIHTETTALGAALLAGLGAKVYESTEQLKRLRCSEKRFVIDPAFKSQEKLLSEWHAAVRSVIHH